MEGAVTVTAVDLGRVFRVYWGNRVYHKVLYDT